MAKRVDIFASASHCGMMVDQMSELDLSYTPPLGSPWDAVQMAAQAWARDHQLEIQREALTGASSPACSGKSSSQIHDSGGQG